MRARTSVGILSAAITLGTAGLVDTSTANAMRGAATSGAVQPRTEERAVVIEAMTLALFRPQDPMDHIHGSIGWASFYKGSNRLVLLREDPDFSKLSPTGDLYIAAFGEPGHFKESGLYNDESKRIPLSEVVQALASRLHGLPADFHGTIHLLGADLGLRSYEATVLPQLVKELQEDRIPESLSKQIADQLANGQPLQQKQLAAIRTVLGKRDFGEGTISRLIARIEAVGEQVKVRDSVVEQLAQALHESGFRGLTVTGPRGMIMNSMSPSILVLLPGVGPRFFSWSEKNRVSARIGSFLIGACSDEDVEELRQLGVALEPEMRGSVDRSVFEVRPLYDLPPLERARTMAAKRAPVNEKLNNAILKAKFAEFKEWHWPTGEGFRKVRLKAE